MQSNVTKSAAEIARERDQRAQYARLTAHYGEIGPAMLNATLLHAKCRKEKMQAHVAGKWNRVTG